MIEPSFEDIGKEVALDFSCETNNKGILTFFNKKFVFIRLHGADEPKAFLRKFVSWPKAPTSQKD